MVRNNHVKFNLICNLLSQLQLNLLNKDCYSNLCDIDDIYNLMFSI
jgi:hypothetical protein